MSFAPIVLFVYNRVDHLQKTIAALLTNPEAAKSDIYIFSDGSKNLEDDIKIQEVRKYIRSIQGFRKVIITEREENAGLADSIFRGVTEVVKIHGKVIVLEDDIVTSAGFLSYMNEALKIYEFEERVMHISGYFYPIKNDLPDTFFFNQASCWGWGTWSRSWNHFNPDSDSLLKGIKKIPGAMKKFNIDGNFNFSSTLEANVKGQIKTWAIKWYASVFLAKGLCLHPNRSLVRNIGNDGSGTNSGNIRGFDTGLAAALNIYPVEIKESKEARMLAGSFLRSIRPSFWQKFLHKLSVKFGNKRI